MIRKLALIALGGGAGSLLRYGLAGLTQNWVKGSFPLGTLVVNVSGCLMIGFLATLLTGPILVRSEEFRLALLIGVLGGFTTFSTFGWETLMLTHDGQWRLALANVVLSNILGLAAAWSGYRLSLAWFGP